jgi:transcriptional regulator with XRE-family HTH domain
MNPATTPLGDHNSPPRVLVGRTVRMMRKAHGVGLRELAAMVDVSPSHLSRVESGARVMSPELHERINEAIASLPVPEKTA